MPSTFLGIGTKIYGTRGHVDWGRESYDAIEWLVIFFVPIVPLKDIHTFDWNGDRHQQVSIRPTLGLFLTSVSKGWFADHALLIAALCAFPFLLFCVGAGLKKAGIILALVRSMGFFIGLDALVSFVHWSFDKRHRKIRLVLGPHQYGSSDPFYWTAELLYPFRDPRAMFGTDSFASAVPPLLDQGQFSKAMWAARFSAAVEHPTKGEELTNLVLQDYRVQQAIVRVMEDRTRWPAVMNSQGGMAGQPQAADSIPLAGEIITEFEEVPEALPADNPVGDTWSAEPLSISPATATADKCKHCGQGPVEENARTCPYCHGKYPNPGLLKRSCDRGVKIGGLLGVGAGIIFGLPAGVPGVVAGLSVGTISGLLLGFIGGNIWALVVASRRDSQG